MAIGSKFCDMEATPNAVYDMEARPTQYAMIMEAKPTPWRCPRDRSREVHGGDAHATEAAKFQEAKH